MLYLCACDTHISDIFLATFIGNGLPSSFFLGLREYDLPKFMTCSTRFMSTFKVASLFHLIRLLKDYIIEMRAAVHVWKISDFSVGQELFMIHKTLCNSKCKVNFEVDLSLNEHLCICYKLAFQSFFIQVNQFALEKHPHAEINRTYIAGIFRCRVVRQSLVFSSFFNVMTFIA